MLRRSRRRPVTLRGHRAVDDGQHETVFVLQVLGIGLAVGRALAAEGAAVALVARNAQRAEEQAARLSTETGARVIGIAAEDVRRARPG